MFQNFMHTQDIQIVIISISSIFEINFGVRQGSVLSPFLFALYLDDLSRLGSLFKGCFVILYADDILLSSPSISQLEKLLRVCERELTWLDMAINFKKSNRSPLRQNNWHSL